MPRGFVSAPLVPPTKPESESEDESDEDELREEAWALGTAAFSEQAGLFSELLRWPWAASDRTPSL